VLVGWIGVKDKVKEYKEGEVLVRFKEGVVIKEIKEIVRGGELKKLFPSTTKGDRWDRMYKIKFSSDIDEVKLVEDLNKNPKIEYATLNWRYYFYSTPSDPYFSSSNSWGQGYQDLWGLHKINCPAAWDSTKGENIIIAIIDTGIDDDHEDIQNNIWINEDETPNNNQDDDNNGYVDDYKGYDFGENDPNPVDDKIGHGSHCAGIAAGCGDNGVGIVGGSLSGKSYEP
jgi:subtilisin family serine protease